MNRIFQGGRVVTTLRIMAMTLWFMVAVMVCAQTPVKPKEPYDSTKAQLASGRQAKLQVQADNAEKQYKAFTDQLQQRYNAEQKTIDDWENDVRKANGWDATYRWNADNDTWTHIEPPKLPAKETPHK